MGVSSNMQNFPRKRAGISRGSHIDEAGNN